MAVLMRVVIQDRSSRLYLQNQDRWTVELSHAENFQDTRQATLFASKSGLRNLDVLLNFGDPKYDLRLTATK